jgi:alkanesulfonate monooxygenase SsuD/methylene tetrahydromethanopterin reductase-like flavin-dependent oxidoreductase (luciferase family)
MQFGLSTIAAFPGSEEMSSKDAFDFGIRMSEVAVESGFDVLGAGYRHLAGPVHQYIAQFVAAAHLLTRFPDTLVMTNVYLMSLAHPVDVAEMVSTLDMIGKPGRFLFGVGQGYRPEEIAAWGIEGKHRGRMLAEAMQIMRQLWQPGATDFDGEFYKLEDADIGLKPRNGKGPPLLVASDSIETVGKICERGGDHWLPSPRCSKPFLRELMPTYLESMERAGKPFTGMALLRDISVAKNREDAEDFVREGLLDYLGKQAKWGQPGEDYTKSFDELKNDRFILGTSEEAAEEIINLHREFKAEYMGFRIYSPGMDRERTLDVIRQVGEEVLPIVRREVGTSSMFPDAPLIER